MDSAANAFAVWVRAGEPARVQAGLLRELPPSAVLERLVFGRPALRDLARIQVERETMLTHQPDHPAIGPLPSAWLLDRMLGHADPGVVMDLTASTV
jgi:hypothetical protein